MHGQHMKYLLAAAGALVVGLLASGTSLPSVLPFLLLLACPLMMVFMMRGMGGHRGHGADHGDTAHRAVRRPPHPLRGAHQRRTRRVSGGWSSSAGALASSASAARPSSASEAVSQAANAPMSCSRDCRPRSVAAMIASDTAISNGADVAATLADRARRVGVADAAGAGRAARGAVGCLAPTTVCGAPPRTDQGASRTP